MPEARRGRPRSEESRRAVLEATRDLLAGGGFEGVSMEGIAAQAGVGKQTVYRWWSSKAVVVAEAVLDGYIELASVVIPRDGAIRDDLTTWLHGAVELMAPGRNATLTRALAAAATTDADAAAHLHERFTLPTRDAIVERLRLAVEAGEVRGDADLETAADSMIATLVFTIIARREVTVALADGIIDIVLRGLDAQGADG